jgi:hypothetical protein
MARRAANIPKLANHCLRKSFTPWGGHVRFPPLSAQNIQLMDSYKYIGRG